MWLSLSCIYNKLESNIMSSKAVPENLGTTAESHGDPQFTVSQK